jgi:anaerobic selenocysteine-containing dehydrogenase
MPDITEALSNGRLKILLLLGTNMLSSFADAGQVAEGLAKTDMVVCVDLFMNETVRRFADVVLPGTAWLEELGFKVTNTHLYLMERALEREGEARPIYEILRSLASSLGLTDFYPWGRWKTCSMASWISRQPATRRWQACAPLAASHLSGCPASPMPIENSIHRQAD